MITPPFLKPGDTIAIAAPARKISPEELLPAIRTFESWGLTVFLPSNIYAEFNQFAGTDEQRIADLQSLLDDDNIKAIICARGGYGTGKTIDKLDFSRFRSAPKWIIGYSDITILHSHVQQNLGIETLHATMPINFKNGNAGTEESIAGLRKCIFGEIPEYYIPSDPLNRPGTAQGVLTGGNLSILYSQLGTPSDIDTDGKVLFIEDIDEYLYHIDRMMITLKRNGKLDSLTGLIAGGFTDMRDNEVPFGKTAKEIILECVNEYDYPLIFDFPAGHQSLNLPLIMGREVTIESSTESHIIFKEPFPSKGFRRFKSLFKPIIFIVSGFILLYLLYSLVLGHL